MTHPVRIKCPVKQAEGDVYHPSCPDPMPYCTDLAGPDGVHIHFWIDYPYYGQKFVRKLKAFASNFNDIVSVSWSDGQPAGYWTHQDMKP